MLRIKIVYLHKHLYITLYNEYPKVNFKDCNYFIGYNMNLPCREHKFHWKYQIKVPDSVEKLV